MSIVILIDEWPSSVCVTFGVNSLPPADLGLMHQLAKKCRRECGPYLALPSLSTTPARSTTDSIPRYRFLWSSTVPVDVGNTRSSLLIGQASFHLRNSDTSSGPIGTVRRLPSLLGGPMVFHASARWRTWTSPDFRSTSFHRRPRSSEARKPVSAATISKAFQRPVATFNKRVTSAGVGISRPASSFSFDRLDISTRTWSPRCATPFALRIDFRLTITLLAIALDNGW